MGKMVFNLVDGKGKLIDLTGLYVKRHLIKSSSKEVKSFPKFITVHFLLDFMPNT